jgi:PAS domain S-box-containing protein
LDDKLLQNNLALSQLLDASVEGILAFDTECRYIVWNRAMERMSGMSRDEVLGKSAFELFPFIKESGEDKNFFAVLAGKYVTSDKRPYVVPTTGREGFYRAHYSPLIIQDKILGGIVVVNDVTERKRAQDAAQNAHKQLSFHMQNSPLAVIEWDSDARVSRWSESAERLFGWRAEEVIGKHVGDWHFVFDEDVNAVAQVTHRQHAGAELLGVQRNRNYTKNGAVLYCEWYNSVLHDESGELVSVLSLVLDVTAREIAEEERTALIRRERELRKQAEVADRLKDEFLATLSHELRTPLTSILGWATLIRNGEVDKEENLDRALEIIERNARAQARLIDDLLDVSRIITGNLQLEVHALNIAPVVEAAIDALRPAADARGIKIEKEFDSQTCLVTGDANRLRQVIWNLLINAIKFTPRGGRVTIGLNCFSDPASFNDSLSPRPLGSSFVRLTVSDTGEGISAEFLPYVFHRFRQEEGSLSRKAGGLGLGLAVVRHLVELHGGVVRAESAGSGMGAKFTVDLPLAADRRGPGGQRPEGKAERRQTEQIQTEVTVRIAPGVPAIATTSAPKTTGLPLVGVRILLVEDDQDSRDFLSIVLEKSGAEVVSAASANAAVDSFVERAPDIVISDIAMADEDGYALIRRLRSFPVQGSLEFSVKSAGAEASSENNNHASVNGERKPVPAIALTGYATTRDREQALAAGYQLHLAKPVEPENLIAAIVSLVSQNSAPSNSST